MTDLQEWANANAPGDEMLWKNGYWDQIRFVRDDLGWLFADDDNSGPAKATVISSHTSKSIRLPVYEIVWRGLTIRMRYNFHNWVVSVECRSGWSVHDHFGDLFHREVALNPIYAEGFKDEWVHGAYSETHDGFPGFTVVLNSRYEVWTFCWLLRQR